MKLTEEGARLLLDEAKRDGETEVMAQKFLMTAAHMEAERVKWEKDWEALDEELQERLSRREEEYIAAGWDGEPRKQNFWQAPYWLCVDDLIVPIWVANDLLEAVN